MQVKNWGADGQKDPGSLQLESFNLGRGEDKKKLSFYTRLCMHLLQIKVRCYLLMDVCLSFSWPGLYIDLLPWQL